MKYRPKMTRQEKQVLNKTILQESLAGAGLYLYENNTNADLKLPRPTKSGIKEIGPREQFQGDNYYMQLVRTGYLRFIRELQSPNPSPEPLNEQKEESTMKDEEKLILDQPETVTTEGTVESVASKPCNEDNKCCGEGKKADVLLNEDPVDDDGFVII